MTKANYWISVSRKAILTTEILRISSVSQKDEEIKIGWDKRSPKVISYCEMGEEGSNNVVENGIVKVPAMGFVTVRVDWE